LSINSEELPQGVYKSNSLAESAVATSLQQGLQQMKVAYATQKVDLDPQQIEEIYSPVAFEKEALVDNAKTEEKLSQARGLVYV
ncbi:ABC transporter permease, partial [bacterium LRH843]|nr:ABC transporter permease [bacterium LRH843]